MTRLKEQTRGLSGCARGLAVRRPADVQMAVRRSPLDVDRSLFGRRCPPTLLTSTAAKRRPALFFWRLLSMTKEAPGDGG